MKGAASSFGIVTAFYFQTEAAPAGAVSFSVVIPDSEKATVAQRVKIYQSMQTYGSSAPGEIALQLLLTNTTFAISGVYWGSLQEYEAAIAPFSALLPAGTTFKPTEANWIDTLISQSGATTLEVPLTGYNQHNTFFAKSLITSKQHALTDQQLTSFFNYIATQGNTSGYVSTRCAL